MHEPPRRVLLRRILQAHGTFTVREAENGRIGLEMVQQRPPDLILLDIIMPRMEGIEAAKRIVSSHPKARIIMVSSVGYQENIVTALQKGARHFVQKPVKPELLYEVVKYVMGADATVGAPLGANS